MPTGGTHEIICLTKTLLASFALQAGETATPGAAGTPERTKNRSLDIHIILEFVALFEQPARQFEFIRI
jgi:hypothetical protein